MLLNLFEISVFGQALARVENLAATNRRTPNAHVVGVFHLRKVGNEAVTTQIFDFFFAAERLVAREGDDFHTRRHNQEGHVETHLVVARAGRTVSNGIGANLVGVARNGKRLEDALRTHRNRICALAQYVAVNHIFQALFVIFARYVERYILLGAQQVGVFFVFLELLGAETAGIGTCGIDLITEFSGEIHYVVGRVESAAICYYYFFLFRFHCLIV